MYKGFKNFVFVLFATLPLITQVNGAQASYEKHPDGRAIVLRAIGEMPDAEGDIYTGTFTSDVFDETSNLWGTVKSTETTLTFIGNGGSLTISNLGAMPTYMSMSPTQPPIVLPMSSLTNTPIVPPELNNDDYEVVIFTGRMENFCNTPLYSSSGMLKGACVLEFRCTFITEKASRVVVEDPQTHELITIPGSGKAVRSLNRLYVIS